MEYNKIIFISLLAISLTKCDNCVTNDFGLNFYDSFTNGNPVCAGMATWSLGNYSVAGVESPHQETDLFITPDENLSCISSYDFEMTAGGILEIYVYMDSKSQRDQIVALANEVSSTGKTIVTGTEILTPLNPDYFNGWHVLRLHLISNGIFSGYVSFLGVAAKESTVIIDSFRYIPPQYDNECNVYDGEFVTSSPPVRPEPPESCVAYNFETDFETLFTSDSGVCTGFSKWDLYNYITVPVNHPSEESFQFIAPQSSISCISSFSFNAEAGGVVEVNVYMDSKTNTDQIAVLVNKIADDNTDVVIGSTVLTPLNDNYADGWHVLRVTLSGNGKFNVFISFLGLGSAKSIVLVDSFRYISPTFSKEECQIYEDEKFETTTTVPITTVAPVGTGEECVTYNFEQDFENAFDTNNLLCSGYSTWHLGDYHSLSIDSINPNSNTFIAPNDTSSCVSSFVFRMMPGGVVKVNTFMKSVSKLDYVIVLAKKRVPSGEDTVAGFTLYYASNANFVEGWNVLQVTVNDFTTFDGYITLLGSTSEDSIVLIDSFSYTPPNSDDTCEIY
ncbi:unnamed protein product [Spodoptera exigua]|nr:unnamed protein product [Spodoptera exigua]